GGAADGVDDFNLLVAAATAVVPVEEVGGDLVRLSVGDVDVNGERGWAVPGAGVASGDGILERTDVGGRGGPHGESLGANAVLGVDRRVEEAAGEVIAVGAVDADPGAFRGGIAPHKRRARGGGGSRVHRAAGWRVPGPVKSNHLVVILRTL